MQLAWRGRFALPDTFPIPRGLTISAVYAGVFPEDKFRLVKAFQRHDHAVGMCGDGANDAPALRQAQMGNAVSTATDVAKSAAGVVLTQPGLEGIVNCIKEGRSSFQRVLTCTLTILINKCATPIIIGAGLVITGHAVLTPFLQALTMLAGDMVTSSGQMQTLTFLTLILAGQANTYAMREHGHLWHSRPARVMVLASLADITIVTSLAASGLLMARLPAAVAAGLFATTAAFVLSSTRSRWASLGEYRLINVWLAARGRPEHCSDLCHSK